MKNFTDLPGLRRVEIIIIISLRLKQITTSRRGMRTGIPERGVRKAISLNDVLQAIREEVQRRVLSIQDGNSEAGL